MDKLEAYKSTNATNDAVVDDVAAKAYVENFALETFARAESEQRTDQVKRQTADAFQAAATFLDLLSIWGALDVEVAAKSKFAKFHALRIARALKEGRDPNETNPKIEEPQQLRGADEDVEQELRDLERQGRESSYKPPMVESALDDQQDPSGISATRPSSSPSLPIQYAEQTSVGEPHAQDVSDDAAAEDSASRAASIGGGYFPSVPTGTSGQVESSVHDELAADSPFAAPSADPSDFYSLPPSAPPAPVFPSQHAQRDVTPIAQAPAAPSTRAHPPPAIQAVGQPSMAHSTALRTDDESVMAAQKHAKWAISALNFEDVPTAVAELKRALESLGGL